MQVLWGVDLRVEQGEIVSLIGSNGVGKSTLLRTISGLLPTRSGRITLGDADIGELPPDQDRGGGHHSRAGRTAAVRSDERA